MALLLLFGAYALARINTQFFPTVERPNVSISVKWSGASAEDVEANMLAVIEPEVRFINNVEQIISYAREGSGTIVIEFSESTDMQKAVSDVETAVKAIGNLPDDSDTPVVSRSQWFDSVAKISIGGSIPESSLRTWAKRIRDDLVDRGIDRIDFTGLRDRELRVDIPDRELRRLQTSVTEISRTISSNSLDLPSGNLEGGVERQVRALSDVETPAALRSIEVKSFPTGEKVTLGDIADVKIGFDDVSVQGFAGGQRAIELYVQRAATADTLATSRILKTYVDEIRPLLPKNLELQMYEIRADRLAERILLLVKNGLGGLILVVGVLFLFLNARIAFWVAAGIPVAIMATVGLMFLSGQTINMISLFGLIMMMGIIVDDAIVVGEHTDTRLRAGDDPITAAENGVGMMLVPVLAAMATTIASFTPITLITGVIGQIMFVLPLVVIAVIIASLVECFLILPGHLAHSLANRRNKRRWSFARQFVVALLIGAFAVGVAHRFDGQGLPEPLAGAFGVLVAWKEGYPIWLFSILIAALSLAIAYFFEGLISVLTRRNKSGPRQDAGERGISEEDEGWFRHGFDRIFGGFRDGPFNWLVDLSFNWRYVTIAVAVGLVVVIAVGLMQSKRVEFVFFPSPEAENIRGYLTLNAGTPETRALEAIRTIEGALDGVEENLGKGENLVQAVFVKFGQSGRNRGDNLAELRVELTSSEVRTVRTPDIVRAWRKAVPKIPDVRRFAVIEVRGGPPGRDIEVQLQGATAAILKKAAGEVTDLISGINGVTGVSDDLPYGKPELRMELSPRGAALGFSIEDIGRQVRNAFEGAIPRRFAIGDDEVTIRITQKMRGGGTSALRNFELRSPRGDFVPLTEAVILSESQGFAAIQRRDGKSTLAVSGDIENAINTTDGVIEELRSGGELDRVAVKYGITYKYGGRAEEQNDAFADLGVGVAVALSVIYIILAWVFGSYWRPFAIMLIIPFGIVGSVFGHWLLGYQLTILSLIGLLGLAGILVNDSIILVTRMEERIAAGEDLETAATGASRDRLRAVLLTSLTTIGGLIPLMFEKSLQAQFLLPMAITIVFGLALATLLVLFLVPALIGVGDDIGRAAQLIFGSGRTSADSSEARAAKLS